MFRCTAIIALALGLPVLGGAQEKQPTDGILPERAVCRLTPAGYLAFSADGKEAATCAHGDSFVRFWDTATGKQVRKLDAFPTGVSHIALAPDGKTLAACGILAPEMHVGVWDAANFKQRLKLKGNHYTARLVAISEDGKRLASIGAGSDPNEAVIWDLETGKELAHHSALAAHNSHWACFLPGGRTLVVESRDGIHLWDWETDRGQGLKVKGHTTAISADGRILAATGDNGVRLIEIATGDEIWYDRYLPGGPKGTLAFAPNGRVLAVSDGKGTVHLVDWTAADRSLSFKAARIGPTHLVFSPNGTRLGGVDNGTALIWDVADFVRRPLARPDKIDPDERDGSFNVLTSTFGKQANQGIMYLAAEGDAVIPRLKTVLTPAPTTPLKNVERWIIDLDSGQFVVRDKAEKGLLALGPDAMPLIGNALKSPRSLEQRRRLEAILKAMEDSPLAGEDRLRQMRGIAVLEQIGTPAARAALVWLGEGNPYAFQTQQTQAALRRMDRGK